MEALWPSDQDLKASTPKYGIRISGDAIFTPRDMDFNSPRRRIIQQNWKKYLQESSVWRKVYRQDWISQNGSKCAVRHESS